jgi:hypothetical protein
MLIDGWSRKMNSQKMLGARLRVIYEDGTIQEHLVSLQPYSNSRENAKTLASEIHRVAAMFGVEPYLKAVLSDTPSVTLAAVRIYNWWRVAQGMPPVDHVLCLIHRINLVWREFERALTASCDVWAKARELVKIVRRSKMVAALRTMKSPRTVVDVPNNVRWHYMIDSGKQLGQIAPYLHQLVEDTPGPGGRGR